MAVAQDGPTFVRWTWPSAFPYGRADEPIVRGAPVRWYTIDRSYRPGLPPIHVESEIVGYVDHGRAWPAPLTDPEALTRDELCSIPGGTEALARWEAGDDTAYQALMDAMVEEADAQTAVEAADLARWALRSV